MRQVVLTAPKQIEFREVAAPEAGNLKSDEVLLRILRIGICGSEIHSYHGQHPATFYPVVQGHEYSAEVVAVGGAVRKVKPGDRVTGRPQLVCGECNPCKRGQYNVCSNLRVEAFQADGVAQDYFVIPEERVVALPEGMSPDYGAMVEPTAVAAHATSRPRALEGRNVVVSGAGTIGNLVAQFARARGAKRVVITDVSDYRLSKARECGIERTLNVAREPLDGKIAELFGDEGYQVAFECAGVESSVRSLMATVEKGGDVVIVGVHAKDPAVSMFHLGEHELNLIGSMMYRHEDYLKAVEEISAGRIRLAPLVSNRFPLEKYREAYEFIDANRETCMKVLIELEDGKASDRRYRRVVVGRAAGRAEARRRARQLRLLCAGAGCRGVHRKRRRAGCFGRRTARRHRRAGTRRAGRAAQRASHEYGRGDARRSGRSRLPHPRAGGVGLHRTHGGGRCRRGTL